jgi:hypothetical protein
MLEFAGVDAGLCRGLLAQMSRFAGHSLRGWSADIGVDRVGNFNAFATTPAALELIVDDLGNIDLVY